MIPKQVHIALSDGPKSPLGYVDFFARTEMCCHIRYCRCLWDADDYSREEALAWILKQNKDEYKTDWEISIANSALRPTTSQKIIAGIEFAAKGIENSEHIAVPQKMPLDTSELENAKFLFAIDGLSLYEYGPSSVYIWQRDSEFNYFEIHLES